MNTNDWKFSAQKIRTQYIEKQSSELDALRALDAKVKRPASIFGYIFGTVGALVLGTGMSLAMPDVLSNSMMLPGIIIGIAGIVMVSITYPIYKKILAARKKKYASQILALSDKILK